MNKNWKTVSQKTIYQSKWLKLRHDNLIRPDGTKGEYDVLEKRDFVVVISKIKEKFLLVKQYRYPVGHKSLEFCQGNVEKNEKPIDAARREFEEETGFKAKKLTKLGKIWEACGYSNQSFYIFLADGILEGNKKLEESELGMKNKMLSENELAKAIETGKIKDSTTISAFYFYLLKNKK